jgi:hypothetical protein
MAGTVHTGRPDLCVLHAELPRGHAATARHATCSGTGTPRDHDQPVPRQTIRAGYYTAAPVRKNSTRALISPARAEPRPT